MADYYELRRLPIAFLTAEEVLGYEKAYATGTLVKGKGCRRRVVSKTSVLNKRGRVSTIFGIKILLAEYV